MSTDFLPHYTADDIRAAKDIAVWAAATCRSTNALARMIGGSQGTLRAVLRGAYKYPPSPILARLLHAAGQRLPKGWEALLPNTAAPDTAVSDTQIYVSETQKSVPAPKQICPRGAADRPVMTAWEPGASIAAASAERNQILKALARHGSQSPLPRDALLTRLGDTPAVRLALEALVQAREVMDAVVITGTERHVVFYLPGRVPVERPGPKAGAKKAKGRGAAISIPPSTRAGRGQGSRP